jgi:REP element-mobilizing transposase RayT
VSEAVIPIREFRATRRNLPHWQKPGATYFLTWRVAGGRELASNDRTAALDAIRFWDGKRWFVHAAVILPDHAHALVRPLPLDRTDPCASEFHNLSELTKSVKGYSSLAVNRRQGQRGTLWQDESFDRIVRDDREFEDTRTYIRDNPVTAGLVAVAEEYPWLYLAESME